MDKLKYDKKSIAAKLMSFALIFTLLSIATAAYAWEHPTTEAFNVTLYKDQLHTYSGAKVDPCICFEGRNSGSINKVYFKPQYSTDNQDSWKTDHDTQQLVNPLTNLDKQVSTYDANRPWWRLCLDNQFVQNGGTAYGWCW